MQFSKITIATFATIAFASQAMATEDMAAHAGHENNNVATQVADATDAGYVAPVVNDKNNAYGAPVAADTNTAYVAPVAADTNTRYDAPTPCPPEEAISETSGEAPTPCPTEATPCPASDDRLYAANVTDDSLNATAIVDNTTVNDPALKANDAVDAAEYSVNSAPAQTAGMFFAAVVLPAIMLVL